MSKEDDFKMSKEDHILSEQGRLYRINVKKLNEQNKIREEYGEKLRTEQEISSLAMVMANDSIKNQKNFDEMFSEKPSGEPEKEQTLKEKIIKSFGLEKVLKAEQDGKRIEAEREKERDHERKLRR